MCTASGSFKHVLARLEQEGQRGSSSNFAFLVRSLQSSKCFPLAGFLIVLTQGGMEGAMKQRNMLHILRQLSLLYAICIHYMPHGHMYNLYLYQDTDSTVFRTYIVMWKFAIHLGTHKEERQVGGQSARKAQRWEFKSSTGRKIRDVEPLCFELVFLCRSMRR